MTSSQAIQGGWKQDQFDPKDHYYVASSGVVTPDHVNLRADHEHLATKIYDQGDTNSCTANATAAAFWYEEKSGRRDETWGEEGPSRLFIYWLARGGYETDDHSISGVSDDGSNARDAIKGLAKLGTCSEQDWPFDPKNICTQPPDELFNHAAPNKITRYYRLDPDRPDENDKTLTTEEKTKIGEKLLDNLRKCLAEQYPVVFGYWYYLDPDPEDKNPPNSSWDKSENRFVLKDPWVFDPRFPRHTFPKDLPNELRLGDSNGKRIQPGHSVLAIGYDDTRQQVLVQNSWGSTWSDNGTFWMPYSWITDFAASNDFWTIRVTEASATDEPVLWEEVHKNI